MTLPNTGAGEAWPTRHEPTCRLPVVTIFDSRPSGAAVRKGPLSAQESLIGAGVLLLSAPSSSACLYRVTVPVNVERTGELGFGPYTASLFPLPLSPSNSPVPLTIVQTPFCGV